MPTVFELVRVAIDAAQLFRAGIALDLLAGAGIAILVLALYDLLACIQGGLARCAACCRPADTRATGGSS